MYKLQEVQKFYTIDRHLLNCGLVIINEKFYQGLSAEDRRIFEHAAREAQLALLGIVTAKESQDIAKIEKAGVKVYVPTPEEYAQFKEATFKRIEKIMKKYVDEKWVDNLYKAIDEAERKTGLKK
jgi:TRAP-type C4-dicarboxylate transport system substrate-binding protein